MADGSSYTKPQRVASPSTAQNKKRPSKFYSHFIFKAIIFTIFLVIIPFFASEAPDVVNPSLFSRWWELLHLIFVGIAVSYGLFSRKTVDDDDANFQVENDSKFDNAQSYMSKLLQVPPVFDDDVDSPTGSVHNNINNNINKVQTWNSQCYRNEPVIVVAKDNSSLDNNSGVAEKPLLLPVRSLKSGDSGHSGVSRAYARSKSSPNAKEFSNDSRTNSRNDVKLANEEDSGVSRGYSRSSSGVSSKGSMNDSKRLRRNDSVKSRVRNESGFVHGDSQVSRSISNSKSNSSSSSRGFSSLSWKSSSGDYGGLDNKDVGEHVEKVQESVVLPSPIPWQSRSGRLEVNKESYGSSLHSLPPSLEESGAAQLLRSQSSMSSRSSSSSSSPKELSPSPSLSSPKKPSPSPSLSSESLAKSVEDFGRRKVVYSSRLPPPPPPPPPPMRRSQFVKSSSCKDNEDISSHHKDIKRSVWSEPKNVGMNRTIIGLEGKARNSIDISSVGKSVRTFRVGDTMSPRKSRETEEEDRRSEDIVSEMAEKPERISAGYNRISNASFSEYPKETREFLGQVLVGSDDESDSEDENCVEERVETAMVDEAPSGSVDEGPDVDKKADEFIAKFREQIRLQRIESIKRSTGQIKRNSLR